MEFSLNGCIVDTLGRVDDVSALSDARKVESAEQEALLRAFDKAVRRKLLAFAADAVGLWGLHVGGGGTSAELGAASRLIGRSRMSQSDCMDHNDACEATSGWGRRHSWA